MKLLLALSLVMGSLASTHLYAASERDQLLVAELDAWRARTGFHQLSIRGNAPDDLAAQQQRVDQALARVEALAAQLPEAQELLSLWQKLGRRALDNPLATQGYADYHAFSELNQLTVAIRGEVRRLVRETAETAHSPLLELAITQQRLASEYLALAAFPSAGLNTGTEQAPLEFMAEAARFESQLAQLQAQVTDNREREAIQRVSGRWQFIRGALPRMSDPDSPRVPLVFYRYSNDMSEVLMGLVLADSGSRSVAAISQPVRRDAPGMVR